MNALSQDNFRKPYLLDWRISWTKFPFAFIPTSPPKSAKEGNELWPGGSGTGQKKSGQPGENRLPRGFAPYKLRYQCGGMPAQPPGKPTRIPSLTFREKPTLTLTNSCHFTGSNLCRLEVTFEWPGLKTPWHRVPQLASLCSRTSASARPAGGDRLQAADRSVWESKTRRITKISGRGGEI